MTEALHGTSLAVWDIPATVAAGESFVVKVGAKSSAGCALTGCRIEVLDASGAPLASARLGDAPWPGTALFWTEVELLAPPAPGMVTLSAHLHAADLEQPHRGTASPFSVAVVARPEHTLVVKVVANGAPIEEAHIRLGPYRAVTDAAGRAEVRMAKGRYQLQVWKPGYEAAPTPLELKADAFVKVEARTQPEDDPDAVWTA